MKDMIMNEAEQIRISLQNKPLFQAGSDAFIDTLVQHSRMIELTKGQILFLHQDDAESFYCVESGWMKVFRETLDGAQAVIDILPAGHIFGETSLFANNTYPYSSEATEPTKLISMPLRLLAQEIEENPKLALAMLSAMARYRKQQDHELEHRTLQNAPQRIGCFLLRLTDQSAEGPVRIHLPYDKTLLASRLGMQPETFSRALLKLKGATGIEVKGSTIELESIEQLMNYSCSACSSEFPCKDISLQTVSV